MIVFEQQRRIINIWFKGVALYPEYSTPWRKFQRIFYPLNLIVDMVLVALQAFTTTDIKIFLDSITFIIHLIVNFIYWFTWQYYKYTIFSYVNMSHYQYCWPSIQKIQQHRISKIYRNLKYFPHLAIVAFIVAMFFLADGMIFHQFQSKNKNYFLFLPTYQFWKINSEFKYYTTYSMHLAMMFYPNIFLVGIYFSMLLFVIEIQFQYNLLFSALNQTKIEINDFTHFSIITLKEQNERDYEILQLLVECIKHHINIMRFVRLFVTIFSRLFITVFIHSLYLSVSGIYLLSDVSIYYYTFSFLDKPFVYQILAFLLLLVTETYPSGNIVTKLTEFLAVFPITIFYCFIGNMLENKNNELRKVIYDVPWYSTSIRFRKMILFMLLNTNREKNLRISPKMKASLTLLASFINTSYSYINVFLNLKKNLD